jgi:hypothetical protein
MELKYIFNDQLDLHAISIHVMYDFLIICAKHILLAINHLDYGDVIGSKKETQLFLRYATPRLAFLFLIRYLLDNFLRHQACEAKCCHMFYFSVI